MTDKHDLLQLKDPIEIPTNELLEMTLCSVLILIILP